MNQQERVLLKQKYLYEQSPVHGDFQQERSKVLELIFRDFKRFRASSFELRGFDPIFLIQRFKLAYGLYNDELESLLVVLANMLFSEDARNVETRILILKAFNYLLNYKSALPNFHMDNKLLLQEYRQLMRNVVDIPIKYFESYVEQLNTFTRKACKYGEDITLDVLELMMDQREMKYLALFIQCLSEQKNAEIILEEIMCESGSWDRDCHWFFILSKIIEKFPHLDFSRYFHTIFQTVIKNFCAIQENQEIEMAGVVLADDITGIRSVLRSDADLLIGLIVPRSSPFCNTIWAYIERLLTLIVSPLNPTSHPSSLTYNTIFLRYLVKNFLKRYKRQSRTDIGQIINDDEVMAENDQGWLIANRGLKAKAVRRVRPPEYSLDDYCLAEFKRIMKMVLPKLLLVDQGSAETARICLELFSFDVEFLDITYQGIMDTLMSQQTAALSTAKLVLLFSYEFTIVHVPQKIHVLIQCCNRMLELVDKLGLVDHLDMIELMIRMFLYFPKDSPEIQSLKHDLMDLLFENMDSFSSVLQLTDNSLAELYLDLQNMFLPLLLCLTPAQIQRYADRLAYKATSTIPKHTDIYQIIVVGFSYLEPKLPSLMLPGIVRQLLKKGKSQAYYDVIQELDWCLTTTNQENMRWFSMLIECTYQYQPQNIVRDFEVIQRIMVLMLKEDNVVVSECGWDILHNIVISLATQHLPYTSFCDPKNKKYESLNVTWRKQTPEELQLLLHILEKYVYRLVEFIERRFAHVKPRNDPNRIVDAIMVPKAISIAALQEKKLLTKILSIQQAVVSALLPRTQNLPDPKGEPVLEILQPHMIQELKNLRADMVKYLNRVMDIMDELHIISEPNLVKIYTFLFNEVHGDCYISDSLSATQEKMTGLIATSVAKPVKYMNNPFLILNQMILSYHCRLELLNTLFPTAQVIHPGYLADLTVFSLHPHFKISGKSFFASPEHILHQYHYQVLQIWWQKVDYNNPNSYFREQEKQKIGENRKERYYGAISNIIDNLKKTATYISMECCLKDNRIRKILFNFVGVYDRLEKKKDRVLLVQTLFTLFAFRFNSQLVLPQMQTQNSQFKLLAQTAPWNPSYNKYFNNGDPIRPDPLVQPTKAQTIACVEQILNESITRLMTRKQTKELVLYAMFNLMYFPIVKNNKSLVTRMFLCFEKLCSYEQHELNELGRVGIFHLVNVVSRSKIIKSKIDNNPRVKPFDDFAMFRAFGCPDHLLTKANCNKYDNVFHVLPKIKFKQNVPITPDTSDQFEKVVLDFLSQPERLHAFFTGCHADKELIEDTIEDNDPIKSEGKAILSKCLKIMNCLLDRDPKKMNIFASLTDNFAFYEYSFYLRLIKKMIKVGGNATVVALEKVVEEFSEREEIYAKKLCAHISISILKFSNNAAFIQGYLQTICTCANDIFVTYLSGMTYVFRQNPFTIKGIYAKIMDRLKKVKGSARLRYIEVWKVYVLSQGRWARNQSHDGIEWMLGGISEASEQLADGLVALTAQSFMLPLNLKIFKQWVQQDLDDLIRAKRVFKINQKVGFQVHSKLNEIFGVISNKIQEEKDLQSINFKMYTKLAARIFESLTVYHFNDYFYEMFSGIISYIIEKSLDDVNEEDIFKRLGQSEYPDSVYRKLRAFLQDFKTCSLQTTKRRLKYLQTVMFCHGFSFNEVEIPNLFINQSSITLAHVSTIGNICKIMTPIELAQKAEQAIASQDWTKYPLLMGYLIASGSMNYQWRLPALTTVVKWKMKKLLRQFVAQWWKGRGQGFKGQETLAAIVKSVENHYSYFA